jgi:hypothetical protein
MDRPASRLPQVFARSAPAIAWRWAGVLPQHAPITVAPRARNEIASVAIV